MFLNLWDSWPGALVGLLALAGCATDGTPPATDAGDTSFDSSTPPSRTLEVVGESEYRLVFGERVDFGVRYRSAEGRPLAGSTVHFALDGSAQDSSLRSLQAQTDSEGLARGQIMAGSTAAAFRVRITAEHAPARFLQVSVSDHGFGRLQVSVEPYDGSRPVEDLLVRVFASAQCDDETLERDAGDRSTTLSLDERQTQFVGLPAGIEYAVTASGRGSDETVLAWGCTDRVEIRRDRLTTAELELVDRPLQAGGDYETTVTASSPDTAARLSQGVQQAAQTPIDAAGGEAALLLDAIEETLRARGDMDAANMLAQERQTGELDSSLESALQQADTGPVHASQWLASWLHEYVEQLELSGYFSLVDEGVTSQNVQIDQLVAVAEGREPSRLVVPLDAFELPPVASIEAEQEPEDDRVDLQQLRARMQLGQLASALMQANVERTEVSGLRELLAAPGGCATLQDWSSEQSSVSSRCDSGCVASACRRALERMLEPVRQRLAELDTERSELRLHGPLSAIDEDADLEVDRLEGASLEGRWSGTESQNDVTGSLEAMRTSEIP
jgi:hypothetical protein